jgi:hypothetical protein
MFRLLSRGMYAKKVIGAKLSMLCNGSSLHSTSNNSIVPVPVVAP